jgi:hypothetical protein
MLNKYNYKIKLVAIAKDEAAYLPEWIYHHLAFGIDTIDIYVNNTNDNTINILESIKENHDINIIDADNIYEKDCEHFQSNAYRDAISKTSKDIYSYILFLDIDEFWTPCDFSTSIKDFIENKNEFDVINFNWALHLDENEYSRCYKEKIKMVNNHHVKYLVKTSAKFQPGIHNALGNLTYSDSYGNEVIFDTELKAMIKTSPNEISPAFVLHRLYRSQKEYVSLLSRGRPRGNKIKNNRFGYYNNNIQDQLTFKINAEKLEKYHLGLAEFIKKNNLNNKLKVAREYIENRYSNTLTIAQNQLSKEDMKILSTALRNINIPEVLDIRKKLIHNLCYPKIFQIGFNKAGTASIYHYFRQNDIPSIHWDNGNLSQRINKNKENNLPLLTGYENYQVFTDMEHRDEHNNAVYSYLLYKQLDEQYPNSIFILNYRTQEKWITSRLNHPGYLKKTMESTGLTKEKVIDVWKDHYNCHISDVRNHFKNKDNLIEIDLDNDNSNKLFNELNKRNFNLNITDLPHTHKTKENEATKNKNHNTHINAIRDAAIFYENTDLNTALELMSVAHRLRPMGTGIIKKLEEYKKKLNS